MVAMLSLLLLLLSISLSEGFLSLHFYLKEESPISTNLGSLCSTSPPYRLSKSQHSELFLIDNSCNLVVNGRIDRESIGRERLSLVARSDDGRDHTSLLIRITLLDVDDHVPTFPVPETVIRVEENVQASVIDLPVAYDPDTTEYSISSFALTFDGCSGAFELLHVGTDDLPFLYLNLISPMDRETISYCNLTITAFQLDTQRNGSLVVHVVVLDMNDNAPYLDIPTRLSVPEVWDEKLATVCAKSGDIDLGLNSTVRVFLDRFECADAVINTTIVSVHGASGCIFIHPAGSTCKKLQLYLRAADMGYPQKESGIYSTIITFGQTDYPVLKFKYPSELKSSSAVHVAEDYIGILFITYGGYAVSSTDTAVSITAAVDQRVTHLSFVPQGRWFICNVLTPIDREVLPSFFINITSCNSLLPHLCSVNSILVVVMDINDNRPMFSKNITTLRIPSITTPGRYICLYKTLDPDAGDNGTVSYTLHSNTNQFCINSKSGLLTVCNVSKPISQAALNITACDAGPVPLCSTMQTTVFVYDTSLPPPRTTLQTLTLRFWSAPSVGHVLGTLRTSNILRSPGVSFIITAGNPSPFSVSRTSGKILLAAELELSKDKVKRVFDVSMIVNMWTVEVVTVSVIVELLRRPVKNRTVVIPFDHHALFCRQLSIHNSSGLMQMHSRAFCEEWLNTLSSVFNMAQGSLDDTSLNNSETPGTDRWCANKTALEPLHDRIFTVSDDVPVGFMVSSILTEVHTNYTHYIIGGDDYGMFNISHNQLVIAAKLDFELVSLHEMTVLSTWFSVTTCFRLWRLFVITTNSYSHCTQWDQPQNLVLHSLPDPWEFPVPLFQVNITGFIPKTSLGMVFHLESNSNSDLVLDQISGHLWLKGAPKDTSEIIPVILRITDVSSVPCTTFHVMNLHFSDLTNCLQAIPAFHVVVLEESLPQHHMIYNFTRSCAPPWADHLLYSVHGLSHPYYLRVGTNGVVFLARELNCAWPAELSINIKMSVLTGDYRVVSLTVFRALSECQHFCRLHPLYSIVMTKHQMQNISGHLSLLLPVTDTHLRWYPLLRQVAKNLTLSSSSGVATSWTSLTGTQTMILPFNCPSGPSDVIEEVVVVALSWDAPPERTRAVCNHIPTAVILPEDTLVGTYVAVLANASMYTCTLIHNELFNSLEVELCQLRLVRKLDREAKDSIVILLQLCPMQEKACFVCTTRVLITDVNDNRPVFPLSMYVFDIGVNWAGSTVGSVAAFDADNGLNGTVRYRFDQDPDTIPVTIDWITGTIRMKAGPILSRSSFVLSVFATDLGSPDSKNSTVNIVINFLERNGAPNSSIEDTMSAVVLLPIPYISRSLISYRLSGNTTNCTERRVDMSTLAGLQLSGSLLTIFPRSDIFWSSEQNIWVVEACSRRVVFVRQPSPSDCSPWNRHVVVNLTPGQDLSSPVHDFRSGLAGTVPLCHVVLTSLHHDILYFSGHLMYVDAVLLTSLGPVSNHIVSWCCMTACSYVKVTINQTVDWAHEFHKNRTLAFDLASTCSLPCLVGYLPDFLFSPPMVSTLNMNDGQGGSAILDALLGAIYVTERPSLVPMIMKGSTVLDINYLGTTIAVNTTIKAEVDLGSSPPLINFTSKISITEDTGVGTAVFEFAAFRPTYQKILYDIMADGSLPFVINSSSGRLLISAELDHETCPLHSFVVVIMDALSLQTISMISVTVEVINVNDCSPLMRPHPEVFYLPENKAVPSALWTFSIEPCDTDPAFNSVVFSLKNTSSPFSVEPDTGQLFLLHALDREIRPVWLLTVSACNRQNVTRCTKVVVLVHVEDEDDNLPHFQKEKYVFNIVHERNQSESTIFVGCIKAVDPDFGRSSEFQYVLMNVSDSFQVDPRRGILTYTSTPGSLGSMRNYNFSVFAVPLLRKFENVSVQVLVNEWQSFSTGPYFLNRTQTICYIQRQSAIGSFVCRLMTKETKFRLRGSPLLQMEDNSVVGIDAFAGIIFRKTSFFDGPDLAVQVSLTLPDGSVLESIVVKFVLQGTPLVFHEQVTAFFVDIPSNEVIPFDGTSQTSSVIFSTVSYTMTLRNLSVLLVPNKHDIEIALMSTQASSAHPSNITLILITVVSTVNTCVVLTLTTHHVVLPKSLSVDIQLFFRTQTEAWHRMTVPFSADGLVGPVTSTVQGRVGITVRTTSSLVYLTIVMVHPECSASFLLVVEKDAWSNQSAPVLLEQIGVSLPLRLGGTVGQDSGLWTSMDTVRSIKMDNCSTLSIDGLNGNIYYISGPQLSRALFGMCRVDMSSAEGSQKAYIGFRVLQHQVCWRTLEMLYSFVLNLSEAPSMHIWQTPAFQCAEDGFSHLVRYVLYGNQDYGPQFVIDASGRWALKKHTPRSITVSTVKFLLIAWLEGSPWYEAKATIKVSILGNIDLSPQVQNLTEVCIWPVALESQAQTPGNVEVSFAYLNSSLVHNRSVETPSSAETKTHSKSRLIWNPQRCFSCRRMTTCTQSFYWKVIEVPHISSEMTPLATLHLFDCADIDDVKADIICTSGPCAEFVVLQNGTLVKTSNRNFSYATTVVYEFQSVFGNACGASFEYRIHLVFVETASSPLRLERSGTFQSHSLWDIHIFVRLAAVPFVHRKTEAWFWLSGSSCPVLVGNSSGLVSMTSPELLFWRWPCTAVVSLGPVLDGVADDVATISQIGSGTRPCMLTFVNCQPITLTRPVSVMLEVVHHLRVSLNSTDLGNDQAVMFLLLDHHGDSPFHIIMHSGEIMFRNPVSQPSSVHLIQVAAFLQEMVPQTACMCTMNITVDWSGADPMCAFGYSRLILDANASRGSFVGEVMAQRYDIGSQQVLKFAVERQTSFALSISELDGFLYLAQDSAFIPADILTVTVSVMDSQNRKGFCNISVEKSVAQTSRICPMIQHSVLVDTYMEVGSLLYRPEIFTKGDTMCRYTELINSSRSSCFHVDQVSGGLFSQCSLVTEVQTGPTLVLLSSPSPPDCSNCSLQLLFYGGNKSSAYKQGLKVEVSVHFVGNHYHGGLLAQLASSDAFPYFGSMCHTLSSFSRSLLHIDNGCRLYGPWGIPEGRQVLQYSLGVQVPPATLQVAVDFLNVDAYTARAIVISLVTETISDAVCQIGRVTEWTRNRIPRCPLVVLGLEVANDHSGVDIAIGFHHTLCKTPIASLLDDGRALSEYLHFPTVLLPANNFSLDMSCSTDLHVDPSLQTSTQCGSVHSNYPRLHINRVCTCTPGFTGPLCRNLGGCSGIVCANGGKCLHQMGSPLKCICPPGYTGPTCGLDIDECSNNPCGNHGDCLNTFGSFSCQCKEGFSGSRCLIKEPCSPQCANGGTCIANSTGWSQCICRQGYLGGSCSPEFLLFEVGSFLLIPVSTRREVLLEVSAWYRPRSDTSLLLIFVGKDSEIEAYVYSNNSRLSMAVLTKFGTNRFIITTTIPESIQTNSNLPTSQQSTLPVTMSVHLSSKVACLNSVCRPLSGLTRRILEGSVISIGTPTDPVVLRRAYELAGHVSFSGSVRNVTVNKQSKSLSDVSKQQGVVIAESDVILPICHCRPEYSCYSMAALGPVCSCLEGHCIPGDKPILLKQNTVLTTLVSAAFRFSQIFPPVSTNGLVLRLKVSRQASMVVLRLLSEDGHVCKLQITAGQLQLFHSEGLCRLISTSPGTNPLQQVVLRVDVIGAHMELDQDSLSCPSTLGVWSVVTGLSEVQLTTEQTQDQAGKSQSTCLHNVYLNSFALLYNHPLLRSNGGTGTVLPSDQERCVAIECMSKVCPPSSACITHDNRPACVPLAHCTTNETCTNGGQCMHLSPTQFYCLCVNSYQGRLCGDHPLCLRNLCPSNKECVVAGNTSSCISRKESTTSTVLLVPLIVGLGMAFVSFVILVVVCRRRRLMSKHNKVHQSTRVARTIVRLSSGSRLDSCVAVSNNCSPSALELTDIRIRERSGTSRSHADAPYIIRSSCVVLTEEVVQDRLPPVKSALAGIPPKGRNPATCLSEGSDRTAKAIPSACRASPANTLPMEHYDLECASIGFSEMSWQYESASSIMPAEPGYRPNPNRAPSTLLDWASSMGDRYHSSLGTRLGSISELSCGSSHSGHSTFTSSGVFDEAPNDISLSECGHSPLTSCQAQIPWPMLLNWPLVYSSHSELYRHLASCIDSNGKIDRNFFTRTNHEDLSLV